VPEKLALTVEQADDIVRRVANEISNPDPIPISFLLIRGLKETFPATKSISRRPSWLFLEIDVGVHAVANRHYLVQRL